MYLNLIHNSSYSKCVFEDSDPIKQVVLKLYDAFEKKSSDLFFEIGFKVSENKNMHIFHGKIVKFMKITHAQAAICSLAQEIFKDASQIEKCWFVLQFIDASCEKLELDQPLVKFVKVDFVNLALIQEDSPFKPLGKEALAKIMKILFFMNFNTYCDRFVSDVCKHYFDNDRQIFAQFDSKTPLTLPTEQDCFLQ